MPKDAAIELSPGFLNALRAAVGARWLLTEPEALATYACDGLTTHRTRPAAVVLPATTEEVQAIVRACAAHGVPFVARGAGTGLSAGALPVAEGIVVGLARMRSVLEVDAADRIARVQPGVINLDVTRAAQPFGLAYAPDPSSQLVCTIGGNVAENSGGAHCLKYGFTANHVRAVTLVTPEGELAHIGHTTLDLPGPDLIGVVCGGEGTLGIVCEITVGLIETAETVETLLIAFDSDEAAGHSVSRIIAEGIVPAAIEYMDALTISAVTDIGYPDCTALLLCELDGSLEEVAESSGRVRAIVEELGATEVRSATDAAERANLWRGRKAAFAAMGRLSPSYYTQDGVVPRSKLTEVLAGIARLSERYGLRVGNVFHAGDGNLHPLVLFDHTKPGEAERAALLAGAILDLCIAAGGSITGEHGVGVDKACHMPKMFTGTDLTVMDRVRAAFDPSGLSNPGKLLPTPRLCGEVPGFHRVHPTELAGLAERM